MPLNLQSNFFELFDLPVGFDVDVKALTRRYLELQREIHPDRIAHGSGREKRLAIQFAAHINEAFDTLKSPLRRAQYLLKLQGVERDPEQTTSADADFLMQQMELREQLGAVRAAAEPERALAALTQDVTQLHDSLVASFAAQYRDGALDDAAETVSKLQFLEKMQREIDDLEGELLD